MIYESSGWKNELYKSFRDLCKFRQLSRPSELSFIKAEKSILFAAYVMRKLHEAEKIPPDFFDQSLLVTKYDGTADLIDRVNWHKFSDNYNLSKPVDCEIKTSYLVNQLIHSFTFVLSFDERNKFDGILVNSDKSKQNSLYFISAANILTQILKISEGEMMHSQRCRSYDFTSDTYGPMKLVSANYVYPNGFDIEKIVMASLNGSIYARNR